MFQTQSSGYGGGKGGPPPAVKYVPLPHHDLPVLIYQSIDKPPIHVVHTPPPAKAPPSYQPPKQTYQVGNEKKWQKLRTVLSLLFSARCN